MMSELVLTDGNWHCDVETVGELLDVLKQIPKDTPVMQGFSDSVCVTIWNRTKGNAHVGFEEGGFWE